MTEEQLENLAADSMAQSVIVELLLSNYLRSFGSYAVPMAQSIQDVGRRTEHFSSLRLGEEDAATFANVVVKMHAALDGYVNRALGRMAEADKKVRGGPEKP